MKIQDVLARITSSLFTHLQSSGEDDRLTIQISGVKSKNIPARYHRGLAYMAAESLARALDIHTYFNERKKKLVLYFPQNQVVVTANNAFVIIDNDVYQMPAKTLWLKNKIYVPVKYFASLLERHTSLDVTYDEYKRKLCINPSGVNIAQVSITAKKNGTVIRIRTLKEFKDGEVTADIRYGWLHVDFYGGKIDTEKIKNTTPAGLVRQIKTFQFSELASLAFQLRKEPVSREIIRKPESKEILVILRTSEEILEEDLAELPDEESTHPNKDLKRQLEEERRKWLIDVVVIDPGHGGKDPGTIGVDGTYEKDIVLSIALKLGEIIKKEMPDVKVVFTRKSDQFVPLKRRTEIANENKGKVFISIHANASRKKSVSGFETYFLGPEKGELAREVVLKENSVIKFENSSSRRKYQGINQILANLAQNAFMRQSEYLAFLVQKYLDKQLRSLRIPNRGVKQGPFWVMVGATMPNILVETGYLSNPYDLKILKTASYQYKIARGIFEGFKQYKRDYENAI